MAPKCKRSNAKKIPGHKTWQNNLTLVLGGSAAQHIEKKQNQKH
jgi:hypothetical protein